MALPEHSELKGKWWDYISRLAKDDHSNHSFSFPAGNSQTTYYSFFLMMVTPDLFELLKEVTVAQLEKAVIYKLLGWSDSQFPLILGQCSWTRH